MKISTTLLALAVGALLPLPSASHAQTGDGCVIDVDAGTVYCDDPEGDPELLRQLFDSAIARVKARETRGADGEGLYARYLAHLAPAQQSEIPDLVSLSAVLASSDPDLYRALVVDSMDVVERLRNRVAHQTEALVQAARAFDPTIGTDSGLLPDRDLLAELLSDLDPDDYVVSKDPLEITAVEQGDPPVGILPLRFSRLRTRGPFVSTGDVIDASSRTTPITLTACTDTSALCVWPVPWDLTPYSVTLLWQSAFLTEEEIEAIVLEDGYRMRLSLNGAPLENGPPFDASSPDPLQDYTTATLPTLPCPTGRRCIATQVLVRDRLADVPQPWSFRLVVEKIVDLEIPIIDFDEFGNPIFIDKGAEPFVDVNVRIHPNPDGDRSWFEAAIAPTFESDRCVDCHSFGTPAALGAHHGIDDGELWESYTALELEPSAYVPGAHVMTCYNCHNVPLTDDHGNPFLEVEWKAPYVDLDVDWSAKTPSQICQRVVENLPNREIRHEHFHEDARLFWAVQAPWVMGTLIAPPADPQDWDEFLARIDVWNEMGSPCP